MSDDEDCGVGGRYGLALLVGSNCITALLTLGLLYPYIQHPHLHVAPLYTVDQSSSFTSSSLHAPYNVCDSAVPYPIELPPDMTSRYCNPAEPARFPYRPPTRYSINDIAMSLLTVDAYKLDRDEACMHTWMTPQRAPFAYFGVSIPRHDMLLQPTVLVPQTDDSFVSNLNKTMIPLRELYRQFPDKKWFMQTSDDAYLDVDTLVMRLDDYDSDDVLYVGGATSPNRDCWLTGTKMDYIGGGLGYIVSAGWMKKYGEEIEGWIAHEWLSTVGRANGLTKYGDAMVGCFMRQHDINITHIVGGHGDWPIPGYDGGEDFPHIDQRWWGWHHLDPHRLVDVHLLFTLQRIDQLQAHSQWEELANYARLLAAEHRHKGLRTLRMLAHIKDKRDLLNNIAGIQGEWDANLQG